MYARPTTRKSTRNVSKQNENLTRPPLPGRGGFIKQTTNKVLGIKRKAETENEEKRATKKRSAFGDITNDFVKKFNNGKNELKKTSTFTTKQATTSKVEKVFKPVATATAKVEKVFKPAAKEEVKLKQTVKLLKVPSKESLKPNEEEKEDSFNDSLVLSSQELVAYKFTLEESADYVTASEATPVSKCFEEKLTLASATKSRVPEGITDYDLESKDDPYAVAHYAQDVFDYFKERESAFVIEKYIDRQPDVSKTMRAILVDWMVEVQESFELNHETLYLAVKLVDLYLSKVIISRDKLQLVGSTAVFIACKFDERVPPYIDDFLYICDDAYKRRELILLEMKMLKTLGFDLGMPLSYRYLRRYARCAGIGMDDLTLARFILETSLMEYDLIDVSDSLLASAALCLALTIKGTSKWTLTLEFYSGYSLNEIFDMVFKLHEMMSQPPKEPMKTIRNKYSHAVFFEVAKITIPEKLNL